MRSFRLNNPERKLLLRIIRMAKSDPVFYALFTAKIDDIERTIQYNSRSTNPQLLKKKAKEFIQDATEI